MNWREEKPESEIHQRLPRCRRSSIKPEETDGYGTGKEGKNEGDRRKTDSAEVRYE